MWKSVFANSLKKTMKISWRIVLVVVGAVLISAEARNRVYGTYGICTPGACIVRDNTLCECPLSGLIAQSVCFLASDVYLQSRKCECTRGSSFTAGNWECQCPESGILTAKNCRVTLRPDRDQNPDVKCIPGEFYMKENVACVCSESGIKTDDDCYPQSETSFSSTFITVGSDGVFSCVPGQPIFILHFLFYCPPTGIMQIPNCRRNSSQSQNLRLFAFRGWHGVIAKSWTCFCLQNGILDIDERCRGPRGLDFFRNGLTSRRTSDYPDTCIPGEYVKIAGKLCLCPDTGVVQDLRCPPPGEHRCEAGNSIRISGKICKCPPSRNPDEAICEQRHTKRLDDNASDKHCTPGHVVVINSTICVCPPSGKTDELICFRQEFRARSETNPMTFIPGEYIKITGRLCLCRDTVGEHCPCPQSDILPEAACTVGGQYVHSNGKNKCPHSGEPGKAIRPKQDTSASVEVGKFFCEPGENIKVNGKVCKCPSSGKRARAICKKTSKRRPDNICKPGEIFNISGRYCQCPDSGDMENLDCTLKFCLPGDLLLVNGVSCICSPSGKIDEILCSPPNKKRSFDIGGGDCTPGQYYPIKGRSCQCPSSGKVDEIICPQLKSMPLMKYGYDYCAPGEFIHRDGKLCLCPNGGDVREPICAPSGEFLCEPGEKIKMRGKFCKCPPSGKPEEAICHRSFG